MLSRATNYESKDMLAFVSFSVVFSKKKIGFIWIFRVHIYTCTMFVVWHKILQYMYTLQGEIISRGQCNFIFISLKKKWKHKRPVHNVSDKYINLCYCKSVYLPNLNAEQKNQPGKIIVVYDEDERLGPNAATTLVQRGYDNLFLLSGGRLQNNSH